MSLVIRRAVPADAPTISDVVIRALHALDTPDYPPPAIEQLARRFTPEAVGDMLQQRWMLVATRGDQVVGTASLDAEGFVRTVFIQPDCQGLGIGTRLLDALHVHAVEAGAAYLRVRSSTTAVGFYERLGYTRAAETPDGPGHTVVMTRAL
ncbi:MAG: acetyltransferase [Pseudomonas sp.]|jgi:N-acetylglutamate synthase-like GNAT family acetyltransferase|uniref:GNAT family N-acetyltransferase n=1 Tax=Pseudomonas entomophila TaxID=312306 RepID=UPI0015E3B7CA|nr:GNAT family N-acetyltransferase [Pseudomonas entomophila]MBA1193116.1 GNAT family N-acetyltransferase [Pseudomonas entomophila]MDF2490330.1 acetyltransferase [Pseudomonas sp.]